MCSINWNEDAFEHPISLQHTCVMSHVQISRATYAKMYITRMNESNHRQHRWARTPSTRFCGIRSCAHLSRTGPQQSRQDWNLVSFRPWNTKWRHTRAQHLQSTHRTQRAWCSAASRCVFCGAANDHLEASSLWRQQDNSHVCYNKRQLDLVRAPSVSRPARYVYIYMHIYIYIHMHIHWICHLHIYSNIYTHRSAYFGLVCSYISVYRSLIT